MSRILVLQFYKDLSYRTDVIGKETALVLLFYITCMLRVSRGRDHMVVGFTTTYVISAYHD